jgi:hypothetical protein
VGRATARDRVLGLDRNAMPSSAASSWRRRARVSANRRDPCSRGGCRIAAQPTSTPPDKTRRGATRGFRELYDPRPRPRSLALRSAFRRKRRFGALRGGSRLLSPPSDGSRSHAWLVSRRRRWDLLLRCAPECYARPTNEGLAGPDLGDRRGPCMPLDGFRVGAVVRQPTWATKTLNRLQGPGNRHLRS